MGCCASPLLPFCVLGTRGSRSKIVVLRGEVGAVIEVACRRLGAYGGVAMGGGQPNMHKLQENASKMSKFALKTAR